MRFCPAIFLQFPVQSLCVPQNRSTPACFSGTPTAVYTGASPVLSWLACDAIYLLFIAIVGTAIAGV